MAKVMIGGVEKNIPTPYNYKKLKRAWPHMEKAANASDDAIGALDSIIAVIAIGLLDPKNNTQDLTEDQRKLIASSDSETAYTVRLAALIDQIEEDLQGPEVPGLKDTVFEIMRESGLMRAKAGGLEGNAAEGPEESSSTETSTPSSQNSSQQDAAAETGSE